MAGHMGRQYQSSLEGTDGIDSASSTGQPESQLMADGDRSRRRRPRRGTLRSPRVGEPWSGRQGNRQQRLEGIGTRMPTMWRRKGVFAVCSQERQEPCGGTAWSTG